MYNALDRLLSTKQVAEYLNVKPITVRRKVQSGDMPSIKIGNRLRFDRQQIDRWLLERSSGRPLHILVVDDEPIVGQLFNDSLNQRGYQVTTSFSAPDALELVANGHFDLIFLDLLMPELDGAELFRRIRQTGNQVPVAIIAAYPESDVMGRAMEEGPFTVMKKPFTGDDILNTVNSFVHGVQAERHG